VVEVPWSRFLRVFGEELELQFDESELNCAQIVLFDTAIPLDADDELLKKASVRVMIL